MDTLDRTPLDSSFLESGLALYAYKKGHGAVLAATAAFVAPGLAMTAKHIFARAADEFGEKLQTNGMPENPEFSMLASHLIDGRPVPQTYRILRILVDHRVDICFIQVEPYSVEKDYQPKCFRLSLLAPPVGTLVSAFGYSIPKGGIDVIEGDNRMHIEAVLAPRTAQGRVRKIFNETEPGVWPRYPCFELDAHTDVGMSGGPVIRHDTDEMCGIVWAGGTREASTTTHFTVASLLWTALPIPLETTRSDLPPGESCTALDLARKGLLQARDVDQVEIVEADSLPIARIKS